VPKELNMKYQVLNKAAEIFFKMTQDHLKKMAELPKVETEEQQKAIFDSWVGILNPSFKNIIETVVTRQSVFESGRTDAPVCMVESTMAKPDANWFEDKPAFVFRFGIFSEQPYESIEQQKAYALQLLKKHTTYSDKDMYIEYVPLDNIKTTLKNSAYGGGIAVFFKEAEED